VTLETARHTARKLPLTIASGAVRDWGRNGRHRATVLINMIAHLFNHALTVRFHEKRLLVRKEKVQASLALAERNPVTRTDEPHLSTGGEAIKLETQFNAAFGRR